MPLLAQFLVSVFSGLFAFFAQHLSKKVAYGVAVGATLLTVTTAFYATCKSLLKGFTYVVTNEWLLMAIYSILPSNLSTCLTIMFSTRVFLFLYRHQLMMIKTVSAAS